VSTDEIEDAYRTLQVDPTAHQVVIRAAYKALARRYHPDGEEPDGRRMTALSRAYDLVRDEQRRRLYDAHREVLGIGRPSSATPVGPGQGPGHGAGGADDAAATAPRAGGLYSRTQARGADNGESGRLDFGRYAGWSIRDLARHDPDYLRWLSRHSSGLRFRNEIQRLLPRDPDPAAAGRGGATF
jgi:curved DNA-binding protein CbpA